MALGIGIGISPVLVTNIVAPSGPVATFSQDWTGSSTPSGFSFQRASAATERNSAAVITSYSNNVARYGYSPSTLVLRGLRIEDQRTNTNSNNSMSGTITGTPGTLPTGWGAYFTANLSRQVVGFGTLSNGMSYIDLRVFGTTNAATGVGNGFYMASKSGAVTNQNWTSSARLAIVAGSLTGVDGIYLGFQGLNSGNATIQTVQSTNLVGTLSADVENAHQSVTGTLATNVTQVEPFLLFNVNASGRVIDFTLRIAIPQLERGTCLTSFIPTSGAAATRAIDIARIAGASWFSAAGGAFTAEFQLAGVNTDRNATVFHLSDGTASNGILVQVTNGNSLQAQLIVGGSVAATSSVAMSPAIVTAYNVGAAWDGTGIQVFLNGAGGSLAAGAIPAVSQIDFGNQTTGLTALNGWLVRNKGYSVRPTNTQMQSLTS